MLKEDCRKGGDDYMRELRKERGGREKKKGRRGERKRG